MRKSLFLIVIFCISYNVLAQTSSREKLIEIIKLDLEMTKSSQSLLKDQRYKYKLLYLYEKLAALECFRSESNSEKSADCVSYLKELETGYPEHPFLICSKKGLSSPECHESYKHQITVTSEDLEKLQKNSENQEAFEREQEYVDLELKLEQYYLNSDLAELRKEKNNNLAKYKSLTSNTTVSKEELTQALELKSKLKADYQKLIKTACRISRTVYINAKEIENRNIFYIKPSKETEDLNEMLESWQPAKKEGIPEQANTTSSATPSELRRIRVFSSQCLEELKAAYEFDRNIIEIYCFHDGMASPKCLNQKNITQIRNTPKTRIDKSTTQYGLESF